jgi:hypothetical protein
MLGGDHCRLVEKVARERVDCFGVRWSRLACNLSETAAGAVIGVLPRQAHLDVMLTSQPGIHSGSGTSSPGVQTFGTHPQLEVDNAPRDDAIIARKCDSHLTTAPAKVLAACMRMNIAQPNWWLSPRQTLSAVPWQGRSW